ncbi:hypothetical protein G6F56_010235 [Rhizopus delemar]|nr:hypothetical protein G6F56_010235 [Rhizopus delemar]
MYPIKKVRIHTMQPTDELDTILKETQKGESSKKETHKSESSNDASYTSNDIENDFEGSDFESDFESEDEDRYNHYQNGYLDDTDEDLQLEEDLLIMEDYLENMVLDSDENLEDLIAWSEMQNGGELDDDEVNEDLYDYSTLDETKEERTRRITAEIEEEEKMMTTENLHRKIMKSSKKKTVSDKVVDPEVFGQTLQASMAQVPPSLRPGMRAWYEKQQRREEEIQKKKDSKEKKKKGKNKDKGGKTKDEPSLEKIDKRLRDFVEDNSITCFEFAPMSGSLRKQVHILSEAYNLSSKGTGHREVRYIVVRKTSETCLPKNRSSIDRYIAQMQTNMDEHTKIAEKHVHHNNVNTKKQQPKYSKKKEIKSKKADKKKPNAPTHGAVVAHNAAPIGENNVGHRMLAAMGWQQGQALGTNSSGIVAPIEAVIRRDKLGLGL